jgi:hypothetical protein
MTMSSKFMRVNTKKVHLYASDMTDLISGKEPGQRQGDLLLPGTTVISNSTQGIFLRVNVQRLQNQK